MLFHFYISFKAGFSKTVTNDAKENIIAAKGVFYLIPWESADSFGRSHKIDHLLNLGIA